MTNPLILCSSFILSAFLSFGQNEQTPVRSIEGISNSYRGCCAPVRSYAPARCTPVYIPKVEKIEKSADITDPELSGFTASPNPTKGNLVIDVPASLIGQEMQIFDMTGRTVGKAIPITNSIEHLTLEGESGIYLISIKTEGKIITERILLQNQ